MLPPQASSLAQARPIAPPASLDAVAFGEGVVARRPAMAGRDNGALTDGYGFTPGQGFTGARTRETIIPNGDGAVDRVRVTVAGTLRGPDGAPVPVSGLDAAEVDPDSYDVSYTRSLPSLVRMRAAGGLEVDLTPHAGLGVTSEGGAAEAGATIRVGPGLTVRDGADEFGDRGRWYLFAAGSGRAVGYNWARTADGNYLRSGMSHDTGSFIGDAQVGVAWRRGDVQTSFGYVHREIKAKGLVGEGFDNDQTEGLLAFTLSFRPSR
ncbi:MAG TPA: lipid A-modifier LpxR family protein [Caulobacteraceae bacterium]